MNNNNKKISYCCIQRECTSQGLENKSGRPQEENPTNRQATTTTESVLKIVKSAWIQETVGMLQYNQIFKKEKLYKGTTVF